MEREEWAWRSWPLLAFAAKLHVILTYKDVEDLTGMDRRGVGPNCCGPIAAYCMINNLPVLSSLVVGKDGLPEDGLTKHIPAKDIPAEQWKCFRRDWGNQAKPTVEQLRSAYEEKFGKGAVA
jgi:hypothetical protein